MLKNNNHNRNNNVQPNPFSPQYPAHPEYFANRRQHLVYFTQAIINSAKVRPPAPSNFMILGDWGMGKTSLVYKMKEVMLKDLRSEVNGFCFHFSLDPVCCRSWDDFSLAFLTKIKSDFETTASLQEKVVKEVSTWKISFSVPPFSVERKEKDKAMLSFVDSLDELWKKHLAPAKVEVATLFMDDIHYFLLVGQPDAYYTIRNTFQELARRGCNYSLIMTGPKLLFRDVADIAEPFTRFFHQFALEPFSIEGTEEAIDKRIQAAKLKLTISKEVVTLIHQKSSGHPYFVMFIVYELINRLGRKEQIGLKDFEESWPYIVMLLERNVFINRLADVSKKEKEVLLKIAQLEKEQFSPSDIKSISGITQFFSRIERKGLLLKKERGLYELFHPLFKEYLKKMASSAD